MQQMHMSSLIFPPVQSLPEELGHPRLREEVLHQIRSDPETLFQFSTLDLPAQEALLEFCMGNRSLQIAYDPFFQNIFHPINHLDRLSRFLSAVLQQPVVVKSVLPREGMRLSADASLMVMDILVETSDNSLINVEMQKVGYYFPVERAFCYGADLLMRQYDRIRNFRKKDFSYRDMRPVFIIIFMEKSPDPFLKHPNTYIHHSQFQLNSGLPIGNLLNFIYIPLDIFLKIPHNELTELEAWLYFLSSDHPLHIQRITQKYPFFKELYRDIINFRYHPKELITMFSESLLIADRNTVRLMMAELHEEVSEQLAQISRLDAQLSEKDAQLSEKNAELSEKDAKLSEKDAKLSEKDAELSEKDAELSEKDAELSEKDAEIARLQARLDALEPRPST